MTIIMRCDGSSRPTNPGPSGAGVAFFTADGTFINGYSSPLGVRSNNEAEYEAVILGLRTAYGNLWDHLLVQADSKLVIMQVTGKWKCNKPELEKLRDEIRSMIDWFESVRFEWIPREQNSTADELAGQAAMIENEFYA